MSYQKKIRAPTFFGMTTTQAIRDLFAWRRPIIIMAHLFIVHVFRFSD